MMLVAGTFLASCSSLQTISFDQLQAGDVSFPDAVRKVAVINNMLVFKAKDNHEILSAALEGDGKVASEALAENIANVNYFDQVVICDSAFRATDEVPRANVVLTKEEIQKLSEDLGVDMILSFDRIHIQTKPGILLYPDYPVPVDAVDGIISPIIRLYIPSRDKPLFVVAKQDTISWEMNPALSDQTIVKEASEFAASVPVEHLLPHWNEVTRFYYDGGNIEMRDAGTKAEEILKRVDALSKSVNKDTPYVTVKPFSKVDFEKRGLDETGSTLFPNLTRHLPKRTGFTPPTTNTRTGLISSPFRSI